MCRLYAFRSSVLSGVHRSLIAAENALAIQSVKHPDGWGVAYYNDRFPSLIRSDKQALEDGLFKEVSGLVATNTLLAHIRQATAGAVNVLNCHPFQHGPWSFAHNGMIARFADDEDVRARFREQIDPRFRRFLLGSTDSEVAFYMFLSYLARRVEDVYHDHVDVKYVVDAIKEMTDQVRELAPDDGLDEPNRLTFIVTNGATIVGTRFRRELHYSTYKTKCPESDTCPAYEAHRCEAEVTNGIVKHLILSSEKVAANPNVWTELDDGDYVCVNYGMHFSKGRLWSA